jgi:NADPH2:quinone reductase
MRAVVIDQTGGSEVLRFADFPIPQPGPGEVLIRVACAGVNPADWKCREGYLAAFFPYRFPFVLGFDAAGTVAAVGDGVDDLKPGMRVFAQTEVGAGKWGSYADYVLVSCHSVVTMPESLSFAEAAATPTPALAAWTGLFDEGGLQAGQTVLVHGGAGAVGSFAIQFAREAGARVIATCGGHSRDYVRELGCERAIDYRSEDIASALHDWAPDGVDLVLDTIGCGSLPNGLDLLKPGGMLVAILTLVAGDPGPNHQQAAERGLRTALAYSKMPSGAALGRIAALMAAGKVKPPRIDILPFEQVAEALDRVQHGAARHKQVLQVADLSKW